MWWNILPSLVITGGLIYLPGVIVPGLSWLWQGSLDGRDRGRHYERYKIFRDVRISPPGTDPYRPHKFLGLDGISDD